MNNQDNRIIELKNKIHEISNKPISIMEVCGTHTMSIAKHAIKSLLPENINIISGPGCPVCVTSATDIEKALIMARKENTIICTFGDMIKVPSKNDSLFNYKNVSITYSPLNSLEIAKQNPDKEVIFLGVGFETTTPLIAATIKQAHAENINNFSVISMHKTVPVALEVILQNKDASLDALILPGHVSAITGRKYFDFIRKFETSGIVAGFDPIDIMECIYLLVGLKKNNQVDVINNYKSIVSEEGNKIAMNTLYEVFEDSNTSWRGIGIIPNSGLSIREKYSNFDAEKKFSLSVEEIPEPKGCKCGEILMAKARPTDCKLFKKACNPSNPIGPCMVSTEGTCAAYYKYI